MPEPGQAEQDDWAAESIATMTLPANWRELSAGKTCAAG
jgi:hypothetical protein